MVCLSSRGGNSEALLRYASRLAGRLNRNWYAVYVQTSSENPTVIDAETQRVLSTTLELAEQLGATVFTYKGEDVVETILQFAKEYRVGQIVIGSPGKKLRFWDRLGGGLTIPERIIAESRNIAVVIVDTRGIVEEQAPTAEVPPAAGEAGIEAEPIPSKKMPPITARQVLLWDGPLEKEEALRQLVKACCRHDPGIPEKDAWEKLLERERQGVTFVGEDVAIPHARLEGLHHPVLALGVSKSASAIPAADEVAHILVLLLSPAGESNSHVKLLGEISRMVRDAHWRKGILGAASVTEIAQIVEDWNRSP